MKRKIFILNIIIIIWCIALINKNNQIQQTSALAQNSKYKIFVDVEESKLYILENGVCAKTYNCAGGKYSTPSPIGTWKIVSKGKWGEGFGGSWLRTQCTMGKLWNSWYNGNLFSRLGEFTWMHKNE